MNGLRYEKTKKAKKTYDNRTSKPPKKITQADADRIRELRNAGVRQSIVCKHNPHISSALVSRIYNDTAWKGKLTNETNS
jgi:hypothetical protein